MANKLLLLDDVEALGRSGDIVTARPGYARNFLLPRGLAVMANKSALRMQSRLKEERLKKAAIDRQEAENQAAHIKDTTVTTVVKVDHDGHMYGSVTAIDIVRLLLEQAGVTLEKRSIQLSHPIKEIGVHTIKVKLNEGVLSSFILKVVTEEGLAAAQTEAETKAEAPADEAS